ncbi:MAG: CRISPR system precrRNA processing endoribonuclease RAMP protein Cas6 [Pseudomonadota bacterium]|nr:CRISPR system precrRNA processing endoribonuclease RAMP protein Cas6 [Pseudomonadota bacterium]
MSDKVFPHCELPIRRARFELAAAGGRWPRYKGFLLHGALGVALWRLSPPAFAALYGAQAEGEAGRLWLLRPPLDECESWLEGSRFSCEIVGMGALTAHLPVCEAALALVGREGLGGGAARFEVLDCETTTMTVAEILRAPTAVSVEAPALRLLTPLRLKQGERYLHEPPSMHLLMRRLFARLSLLARQAGMATDFDWKPWLAAADAVALDGFRLAWVEWPRYSARQRAEMVLGGLQGELLLSGDLAPWLPWLRLLEALHLGGKTTFGFGRVEVAVK